MMMDDEEVYVIASFQYVAGGDLGTVRDELIRGMELNSVRYTLGESSTQTVGIDPANLFLLYTPRYLELGHVSLERLEALQVLVRFHLPPYPDERTVRLLEGNIRQELPPPSFHFRLLEMKGENSQVVAYLARHLHEVRLECLQEIQSLLASQLGWIPVQGLTVERPPIPEPAATRAAPGPQAEDIRDIPKEEGLLREDQQALLKMWQAGHTAKEIGLRTARTEKTILNQLTLLRRLHGEVLVPRRR